METIYSIDEFNLINEIYTCQKWAGTWWILENPANPAWDYIVGIDKRVYNTAMVEHLGEWANIDIY